MWSTCRQTIREFGVLLRRVIIYLYPRKINLNTECMQCSVMLVYGLYEEGYGVQFAGWKIFPHHNNDHFISGPNSLKVLQRRVPKSCGTDVQNVYFLILPSRFCRGFSCKRIRHDMLPNRFCANGLVPKTKYRNFETNIPRKGILGSQSQFPYSCICEWFIYSHDLPILLEEICRLILGLYKSLTDTWMWKWGLRPLYSQKRNT